MAVLERTYSTHPAAWNVSWRVAGAGVPFSTDDTLLIRRQNSGGGVPLYRVALGFRPTYPDWASVGGISTSRNRMLAIFVDKPTYPSELMFVEPATALAAGMTGAQLNTAFLAGSAMATTFAVDRRAWYLFVGFNADLVEKGLFLTLANEGVTYTYDLCIGSIATGRGAVAFHHYMYTLYTVPGYDPTDPARPDLSAVMDYLQGQVPADVEIIDAGLDLDEQDTDETSLDIGNVVEAGASLTLRASCDPLESWRTSGDAFGSVSIHKSGSTLEGSNIIDTDIYRRIHGTPVRCSLGLRLPDQSRFTLASIRGLAEHTEEYPDHVDIPILSGQQADLDGKLCALTPTSYFPAPSSSDHPGWDSRQPEQILFDLLLNLCPRTHWADIYPDDIWWLRQRFAGTWSHMEADETLTATFNTVREMFDAMLQAHVLCCGTDLSGQIRFWHPAAYRPSVRTWTIASLEDMAESIVMRGLEADQYDGLHLTYNATAGPTTIDIDTGHNPNANGTDSGRIYDIDLPDEIYGTWPGEISVQIAMMAQYAQRLLYPAVKLSFRTGLQGLTWQLGDQIVVTSPTLGLVGKPFMVTDLQANPMDAECNVEAVHYTGWPGGHSRFQTAGPDGLWRWIDWRGYSSTASKTLVNQTWNATSAKCGDFAIAGPGSTWALMGLGTWESATMYIEETGAVDGHGAESVAVTFATNSTVLPTAVSNQIDTQLACWSPTVQLIGAKQHDWLWRWWDTSTGEGLALLVEAPTAPNPDVDESIRLVLAHCSDCDPGIGGWTAVILSSLTIPYGFPRPSLNNPSMDLIRSISVFWDAEDVAHVYDGGRFIGTLGSTPAPAIIDQFDLRTPKIGGAAQYITHSFVRFTRHAAVPTDAAVYALPDDGLDPHYP